MNPWPTNILDLLRNILRFSMWLAIILNGLMALLFTVAFVYSFLTHFHAYLHRTIFKSDW